MIAQMDHLEIVCMRRVLRDIIEAIQVHGGVHIEEVPLAVDHAAGFLQRTHLSEEQRVSLEALDDLRRILDEIHPLLTSVPEPDAVRAILPDIAAEGIAQWRRNARAWSRNLRSLVRRRTNIQDNIDVLTRVRQNPARGFSRSWKAGRHPSEKTPGPSSWKDMPTGPSTTSPNISGTNSGQSARSCGGGRDETCWPVRSSTPPKFHEDVGHILHEHRIATLDPPDNTLKGANATEVLARIRKTIDEQRTGLVELDDELRRLSDDHGPAIQAMRLTVDDEAARIRISP